MKKQKTIKIKKKLDVVALVSVIIIGFYCLSILFVLAWGLLNSVKGYSDPMDGNLFGLPRSPEEFEYAEGWMFQNYKSALTIMSLSVTRVGKPPLTVYVYQMLGNSFVYSVAMSVFQIASMVLAAYACAKYDFKGRGLIYGAAVFVMIIPIIGSLSSELRFARALGLYDSLLGVCLMKCKYAGLYFLVFYATFRGISWTYAEAAQLDGAGDWYIFFHIMLPLARNTISAVFILLFIQYWNEYYTPMMFLPSMPTVAYGLYRFQFTPSQFNTIPVQLAASFIVCVPIIIVFCVFKDKIIGNITMGGLKG